MMKGDPCGDTSYLSQLTLLFVIVKELASKVIIQRLQHRAWGIPISIIHTARSPPVRQ
jgi:hypothetical protein